MTESISVPQRGEKHSRPGWFARKFRRQIGPKNRPPKKRWIFFKWCFYLAFSVTVAVAITAYVFGKDYYDRAEELEIGDVSALAEGALVLDSTGEQLGAISEKHRILVDREDIPDHFVEALLAAEDSRFFEHPGFDSLGMLRAAVANIQKQEIDQGASTITQQLARNSFELGGRNIDRKVLEIFVAHRIESEFTKDEILTHYVNRIYLGNGFWGLGAAAQGYFGKLPIDLTPDESAMICGLIRSPNPLSPFKNPKAAVLARNRVLGRMVNEGFLSREEADELLKEETNAVKNDGRNNQPRYLLAKVKEEAIRILGEDHLEGIEIQTSINPVIQKAGENAISRQVEEVEKTETAEFPHPTRADFHAGKVDTPDYLQGSAVVIENETGRIICAVASRDMQESEYDRVSLSLRPAGTAFAPFVYAAAFESEVVTPAGPLFDAPIDNREVMLGGEEGVLGEWGAEGDANQYLGKIPAGTALIDGKNAATVRLGFQVGLDAVKDVAYRSGIYSELPEYPSTFLGAGEVSLLALTHAYTIFPGSGIRAGKTGMIDRIVNRSGKILYSRESDPARNRVRAVSAQVASDVSTLLAQSVLRRARSEESEILLPLQGKVGGTTGTTFNFDNAWFVGFNKQFSWGVWIGMDQPATIYPNAFSRDVALPAWVKIGQYLESKETVMNTGDSPVVQYCVDSCLRADADCAIAGHRVVVLPVTAKDRLEKICRLDKKELTKEEKIETPDVRAKPVAQEENSNSPVIPKVPVFVGEDAFGILD